MPGIFVSVFVMSVVISGAEAPSQQGVALSHDPYAHLAERAPFPKVLDLTVPRAEHRLVVKFIDKARVRLSDDKLKSFARYAITGVDQVAIAKNLAIGYRPLIDLPADRIESLEQAAAVGSGVRPIDLRGMFVVEAQGDRLEEIGEALAQLDIVEWVEFEPLRVRPPACADILPPSSILTSQQGYTAFYDGVNIDGARATYPNSTADGITIADIEYGSNGAHEDLCNITSEPGQTIPSFVSENGWDSHGTAALGIMTATQNAYGVTGLAHDADAHFFPEWSDQEGSRRATAITNAAATLDAGDVLVLEMQTTGSGDGFGPAELSASVWSAVKNATDAGRVVVAAAGNGNQNLDADVYLPYMNRGDSGAIIVGAGRAGGSPSKLGFSTFGSRVNVQGWGQSVASTGYGGLATFGNDKNQRYTSTFNGTSSATPCVAGVVAVVQGYAKATYNEVFTSQEMRDILMATGVPQSSGGNIGPRPDAEAAIAMVDTMFDTYCDADFNEDEEVNLGDFGIFGAAFQSTVGTSNWDPRCDFDQDGDVDLGDFGVFGGQFLLTPEQCSTP